VLKEKKTENEEVNVMFDYAKLFPYKNQKAIQQFELKFQYKFKSKLLLWSLMVPGSPCIRFLLNSFSVQVTCSPRTLGDTC
jgi:hypothetical protein